MSEAQEIEQLLAEKQIVSNEEFAVITLNEKYNDTFEVETIQGQSLFDGYYTAIAYQVDRPEINFRAMINNDGTGSTDNYVTKLVCAELSDRIAQNLDDLNGVYSVYSVPTIDFWELKDPSITFEECYEGHPKMKYIITLNYVPDELVAEDFYNSLSHIFANLPPIAGRLNLYLMDENLLKQVLGYLENSDKMYDDYKEMTDPAFLGTLTFENGKITNSLQDLKTMIGNFSFSNKKDGE